MMNRPFKGIAFFLLCILFTVVNLVNGDSLEFIPIKTMDDESKLIDAIDSIKVVNYYDLDEIYAKWLAEDNDILDNNNNSTLTSGKDTILVIEWSIKDNSAEAGDYFTCKIPNNVFDYEYHGPWNDMSGNILDINDNSTVIATYTVSDNGFGEKETKIIFTDYIEHRNDIKGNFKCHFITGTFTQPDTIELEFKINGNVSAILSDVSIAPAPPRELAEPENFDYAKWGTCDAVHSAGGYYYFKWEIWINLAFNEIDNFSFADIIPDDSPHTFITADIAQSLGINTELCDVMINEYTGADGYLTTDDRYNKFREQFNDIDGYWLNSIKSYSLENSNGYIGIGNSEGIRVSDTIRGEKNLSATLGRITRPVVITYYTVATIKLDENALYDTDTVSLIKNTVTASNSKTISASLQKGYNASGGVGQGIMYSFDFTKVNEDNTPLQGVVFGLYNDDNPKALPFRLSTSEDDGKVTFNELSIGTYYLKELITPEGYISDDTFYKVVINSNDVKIFNNDNYTDELTDKKIINKKPSDLDSGTISTTVSESELTAIESTAETTPTELTTIELATETTLPELTTIELTTEPALTELSTSEFETEPTIDETVHETIDETVVNPITQPAGDTTIYEFSSEFITAEIVPEIVPEIGTEFVSANESLPETEDETISPFPSLPIENPNQEIQIPDSIIPSGADLIDSDLNIYEIINDNGIPMYVQVLYDTESNQWTITDIDYEIPTSENPPSNGMISENTFETEGEYHSEPETEELPKTGGIQFLYLSIIGLMLIGISRIMLFKYRK